MVPRLLAAARAMRSCTCADVIQPCYENIEGCEQSKPRSDQLDKSLAASGKTF